ncbi:MAG: small-conductance mechanosensitive ion channel [Chloroflexota bacterium]|nr:small-conductance mechanosensitive ion channel [Chloroflexota bacterium]
MDGTVATVTNWGDAIFLALAGAVSQLLGFIPRLLGALVILFIGWLIAKAVGGLVTRGLRAVRFNQVADRAEIDQFLDKAGVRMDPSSVVGRLAYWFLMLIFIGAAFNAFGLTQVNIIINQIVAFIPNVVVAMIVLLLGALIANFVANLVRGASGSARIGDPNLLGTIARAAVLTFAALIALDQLEIAPTIINTLWTALIGTFAVAFALAFGLGGREVASRILEDWYSKRGEVADKASRMAGATRSQSGDTNPRPISGAPSNRAG